MSKRVIKRTGIVLFILIIIIIFVVNFIVNNDTKKQIFSNINAVPKNRVGLLLGTAKYMDKAKNIVNDYYQARIDATVALYMAGKIDYIIVSGDNSTTYYNEPVLMRDDLIARGIPVSHIFLDNAGFRTLDSILRCRDIFGQKRFTIISQTFHVQRAVFIANRKELDVVAFCAVDGDSYWAVTFREKLARVKMMFDLLLNKQAKFYGEKIEIS